MNCFKLPYEIIDNLNNSMAKFYWSNTEGEKGIHWKSGDKLCEEKHEGGLGFKDLECMKLALLAKQGWRIMTQQASLLSKCARTIKRNGELRAKAIGEGSRRDAGNRAWKDVWQLPAPPRVKQFLWECICYNRSETRITELRKGNTEESK
ncbi:hypothetical protein LIER_04154 [Lithospermum erythrorhizon]|uniref:Uncharacterized protein n=1 Tax=Lithospermum erythrorhizon TaxID=34254 RepID=A0AAV3NYI8_LITER